MNSATFSMITPESSPQTPHLNFTTNGQQFQNIHGSGGETEEETLPWFLHPQWQGMAPLGSGTLLTIGVVMSVLGVAGTVGNLTVILLLWRHKKLQTRANIYVLNLAIADLLMCVGNFPILILSSFSGKWTTGYTGCKIYSFIGGLSGFVSINTLAAMACDRYNAIYRHKGLRRSRPRSYSLGFLLSLWIYSGLWAAPPFVGWGHFSLDGGQISCCFDYLTRSISNVTYIVAIFVFCFGFQVLVILFCYCSIVRVVCIHGQILRQANFKVLLHRNHYHHQSLQRHQSHDNAHSDLNHTEPSTLNENYAEALKSKISLRGRGKKRRRVEVLVTRLVVIITISFVLAWMPFAVVALVGVFGDASMITPLVSVLPGMLAKISTIINPLLYAIGHPQYRSLLVPGCGKVPSRKVRGRKNSGGPALTSRGILSSVYFATVFEPTENGVSSNHVDMDRSLPAASGSISEL